MHTNWDDLRFILSVAREGSVAGAARALGVNHSTVLRRTNAYEDGHGVRVFDRRPSGYVLTEAGAELVRALSQVDDQLLELERKVAGHDLKLEGRVRITTTDSISLAIMGRHLASLTRAYPLIAPELRITNGHLDISRRDAEIAIRPCRVPPDELVGIKIAPLGFGFYASADYAKCNDNLTLEAHRWLVMGGVMSQSPPARWLEQHVPKRRRAMIADSFVALGCAAVAGMGVALLPCCLQLAHPSLVRLAIEPPELDIHVWVLMHRDLQRAAIVRACAEHLTQALREDAAILSSGGQR